MTGLEFLSATIGQLVWPLLVVVLILVLKRPLKRLLESPRLTRVKAGPSGVEVEFKEELNDAERQLSKSGHGRIDEPQLESAAASDFLIEMKKLAEVSPRSVVMEAHTRLEKVLRDSTDVDVSKNQRPRLMSMRSLVRAAVDQGVLTSPEASVLNELSHLRNLVAHEPDQVIDSETAVRYAELAMQTAIAIRLAQGKTIADGPPL